ncbi:hypothetical protein F5B22DRAFT_31910 [Xylaria bambusicola]|uniref:uncharacterized protein n=1 Tax=Xylaria bambusicola TaxID=326684 RepID=UPI002008E29A|nr:uncharacterized protein F5B22DRAFT_31910 [Xylaria bambusicola]KAI0520953.1 hypothetical protein F5B22DRAFT_31910 [Xylaria bambusicola]
MTRKSFNSRTLDLIIIIKQPDKHQRDIAITNLRITAFNTPTATMPVTNSLQRYLAEVDMNLFSNETLEDLFSILNVYIDDFNDPASVLTKLCNLEDRLEDVVSNTEDPLTIIGFQALQSVLEKVEQTIMDSHKLLLVPPPVNDDAAIAIRDRALYVVRTWQVQEAHMKWLWTLVRQGEPELMERFVVDALRFPTTPNHRI